MLFVIINTYSDVINPECTCKVTLCLHKAIVSLHFSAKPQTTNLQFNSQLRWGYLYDVDAIILGIIKCEREETRKMCYLYIYIIYYYIDLTHPTKRCNTYTVMMHSDETEEVRLLFTHGGPGELDPVGDGPLLLPQVLIAVRVETETPILLWCYGAKTLLQACYHTLPFERWESLMMEGLNFVFYFCLNRLFWHVQLKLLCWQ